MSLVVFGCTTTVGPVVSAVVPLDDGRLLVKRCDLLLNGTWGFGPLILPFVITDAPQATLVNCRVVVVERRREP